MCDCRLSEPSGPSALIRGEVPDGRLSSPHAGRGAEQRERGRAAGERLAVMM